MAEAEKLSEKKKSSDRQWIKNWPESERPREKHCLLGPEALSDGELLAVLLRIGKTGQSAEDLGRQILTKFDDISGIDRAHFEELRAVSGMGHAKAAQLKAAIEIGKRVRMQNVRPQHFDHASKWRTFIRKTFTC
ncbi:MAG TPA: hypothetical protein DCG53_03515 [Syntrophus sp. (in: bacteria)]|jgi:DNA repair protein RadC|nr:hypothetical protein [Syntrophus sp. (in: bacteria)]